MAIYWSDMEAQAGDHLRLLSNEQKAVIRASATFNAERTLIAAARGTGTD